LPTVNERRNSIEYHIHEEFCDCKALTLCLDRSDAVVRQRFRQKMEILTDTAADIL
jgi:hypothetical protein